MNPWGGQRPEPVEAPVVSWREIVEAGIRTVLMGAVLVGIVPTVAMAGASFPEPDLCIAIGLSLLVVAHGLMVWTIARGQLGGWPAMMVAGLMVLGLSLVLLHQASQPNPANTWWPRAMLIATPGYLIVSHRRGWTLAAALIAVNAGLHIYRFETDPRLPGLTVTREVATETGQYLAYAVVALFAVHVTRAAGRKADAALARGRDARAAAAANRQGLTQVQEADRFVHDEVLHTLRLIAMDRQVMPADRVLPPVAHLRARLEPRSTDEPAEDFADELRRQAAGLGLTVRVDAKPGWSLPRDVASTLALVVRECLRNVAKHSGTRCAVIDLRRSRFAVTIAVTDTGRGFDAGTSPFGLGLQQSVLARMADIGGSARIASRPGAGTTVHLSWSPIPGARFVPGMIGGGAVPELYPSMGLLILPTFAQGLWAAAFLAPLTRLPSLSVVASWAVSLAGVLALGRGLRSGLTRWHSALLGLLTWCSALLSVLLLPADLAPPRLLWLAVTVTGLPAILTLFRPLRESVVVGLGVCLVTLAALLITRPSAPLVPILPILLTPVFTVGVAIGVRRLIDRCAFEIWSQEKAARDDGPSPTESRAFRAHLDERLGGCRPELTTFLDAIAADAAVLELPATRQRAEHLEATLRSRISPTIDSAFAQALAALAAGGWAVRSRLSADPPPAVQQSLAMALAALPRAPESADDEPGPEIAVTATEHQGSWQLSLLAHPAEGAWARHYAPGAGWTVTRTYGLHAVCLLPPAGGWPPAPADAPPEPADRSTIPHALTRSRQLAWKTR